MHARYESELLHRRLAELGFTKLFNEIDMKEAARQGLLGLGSKPLDTEHIQVINQADPQDTILSQLMSIKYHICAQYLTYRIKPGKNLVNDERFDWTSRRSWRTSGWTPSSACTPASAASRVHARCSSLAIIATTGRSCSTIAPACCATRLPRHLVRLRL